jgi:hypothetical protein
MSLRASCACAAAALGLAAIAAAAPVRAQAPADTAPSEDIRDIRGPRNISPTWLVPALLAGAVALAIVGYAAWRKKRRPVPRTLEPFEIALQRLDDVRRLLDPSSVREFSIAISDIVREYIEEEFKVTATHRTTEEFLRDLLESSHSSLAAHRELLAQFLQLCDMAKFAGMSLSKQIMESLHQGARDFVIETSRSTPAAQSREVPRSAHLKGAHDSLPST